jgi:WD40 repeat protein
MELVQGRSLDEVVKTRGPLPEGDVARIGAQIAAALQAAHAAGIVHRDIKPANVLLEGDRVVVTDFGIAALTGEATLTPQGALIGTPAYMAPEQINDREATAASDLWSLGATLYTAVEGRPAFTGSTTAALLLAVSRGKPAATVNAGVLRPVLRDLMRINPDRRSTAAQAAATLAGLATTPMQSHDVRAAEPPLPEPSTEAPTHRIEPSAERPRARLLTRRRLLAGLGATALVAGPTAYYLARDDSPFEDSGILDADSGAVTEVVFSPDSRTLASVVFDGTIRMWDVATRKQLGQPLTRKQLGLRSASVAFSPDGKTLVTGGADNTIRFWDVATRKQLGQPLNGGNVNSLAFSPDGKLLASDGDDKTIQFWDVGTRKQSGRDLIGHTDGVLTVAFSPDGKRLASGGYDKTIRIWDVATRKQSGQPLAGHTDWVNSLAFSPDGNTLASASGRSKEKAVRLWDLDRQVPIDPLTGHTDGVGAVAFSPDGTLASGSLDKTVRLWNVAARKQLGHPLTADDTQFISLAFSPDRVTLAGGGNDGKVWLWRNRRYS